jgi:Na+-transporting methylmalonyl-CoA/oxaloacetate decarboxylase gamma subunit
MAIDWTWAEAMSIGGIAFGITFLILILLAAAIWLVGQLLNRAYKEGNNKKGE